MTRRAPVITRRKSKQYGLQSKKACRVDNYQQSTRVYWFLHYLTTVDDMLSSFLLF